MHGVGRREGIVRISRTRNAMTAAMDIDRSGRFWPSHSITYRHRVHMSRDLPGTKSGFLFTQSKHSPAARSANRIDCEINAGVGSFVSAVIAAYPAGSK